MTENKRFTIKSQDDLFGVMDNYSADKVCVVNGIRTEIETKWLCDVMNDLNDENEQLKKELSEYKDFVFSDDKILCYTCLFCIHKGIYEVDCDVKGHIDVHGVCDYYTNSCTKKELQELLIVFYVNIPHWISTMQKQYF